MNMNKTIKYFFTFICCFTFTLSVNAACKDIIMNNPIGTVEQRNQCLSSNEKGFACEIGYQSTGMMSHEVCVVSDECAEGYVMAPGNYCYQTSSSTNEETQNNQPENNSEQNTNNTGDNTANDTNNSENDTDNSNKLNNNMNGGTNDVNNSTKCSSYSTKKSCLTMNHCEWINGTCTNSYIADDPCSEKEIAITLRIFGYILLIVKILIPLIIIIFGTIDLFKSIIDKDEKSLMKQIKVLLWRIVAGIFIFFIPNLIYAIFGLSQTFDIIEDNKYNNCMTCIFKPTQCNIPENSPDLDDSTSNNSSSHVSSSGRVHGGGGGSF